MKSFLKTVRRLIHKLALVLGYLLIVAAILFLCLEAYQSVKQTYQSVRQEINKKTYGPVDSFIQGLDGHKDYLTHKGLKIPIGCFSNTWWSGDNYEHYYETYTGNVASWEDESFQSFVRNIGDSMGSIVPINDPLDPGWDEKMINLSPRIDQCDQYLNYDHAHNLVLTPINLCNDYAPHLDETCLGTVLGVHHPEVRDSKYIVYGLYGIYQGYEEVEVIVPIKMYKNREIDGTAQFLVDAGWKVE
jgi:hypothetical protein|tara:strand:- start:74 stop:808 length:735 start_codon:yes stop_codon:yes gene_type:complete